MIVFKAITVGLVLFASQTVANICTGRRNGDQLPNPSDCSSFFVCDYGEPKLFKCLNDLLYDPEKSVCNWAYMVKCGQLGSQEPSPNLPNTPYYPNNPYPEEQYPIPQYPIPQYPLPQNPLPQNPLPQNPLPQNPLPQYTTNIPQNPPYTGHPPPMIDVPNHPEYNEADEFYPGLIEPLPNVFHCTNPEFYFAPHPRSCEKYFICENYRIHNHQCGEGIHWDYVFSQCDYPLKTFCYSGGITSKPVIFTETEFIDENLESTTIGVTGPIEPIIEPILPPATVPEIECPGTQAFIPYPEDCQKYYLCIGGIPIATSCPDKMAWDKDLSQCNEDAWSQCFG